MPPEPCLCVRESNVPKMPILANDFVMLFESPQPEDVFSGSPGICRLEGGRLLATFDVRGAAVSHMPGPKYERRQGYFLQGHIATSDDGGRTWQPRGVFPFLHARPFIAGDAVYILGHAGDLAVIRSDDAGETWSGPAFLTQEESWHQAPTNVLYANGCVYLVMEKRRHFRSNGWPVSELAPILMRASVDSDLTVMRNWTFASELSFVDAVHDADLDWFGVPFYPASYPDGYSTGLPGRACDPVGWLETNVVQIADPDHFWYDPRGRTFHLFARAHSGRTNLACVAKVVQNEDGSMETMLETAPSGRRMLYVPCPGGQMKFHVLHDPETQLFWLLSTQSTDSMTRPERLPHTRYGLADNERRRLQLHFSKNCLDWCFAGIVAAGESDLASRHYASMAFDGDDLVILSRSGDEHAANPHDVNLITFHRVRDFRQLVY